MTGELDAMRQVAEAHRRAVQEQIGDLHREMAGMIAAQFDSLQSRFREELRQAVASVVAGAATEANAAAEERIAPLRAAVEAKDREIAELRTRLNGSDQATLDLLQGVGEICRRAAERIAVQPAPAPEAQVEADAAPPAEAPPQPDTPTAEAVPPGEDLPDFAQSPPPGKLWRVPLVSSLVLTTGLMLARHFL